MKLTKNITLLFAIMITAAASLQAADPAGAPAPAEPASEPAVVWTPELVAQVEILFAQEYARLDAIRLPWSMRSFGKPLIAGN